MAEEGVTVPAVDTRTGNGVELGIATQGNWHRPRFAGDARLVEHLHGKQEYIGFDSRHWLYKHTER